MKKLKQEVYDENNDVFDTTLNWRVCQFLSAKWAQTNQYVLYRVWDLCLSIETIAITIIRSFLDRCHKGTTTA